MKSSSVICFACFVTVVMCAPTFDQGRGLNDNSAYYERYLELDKKLMSLVDKGAKKILPTLLEAGGPLNISARCIRNTFTLIRGIRKLKMWALKFLDASPKIPEGLLRGSASMLGDFDECLSTTVPTKNGGVDFKGQYCLVKYSLFLPKLTKTADILRRKTEFLEAAANGSDLIRFVAKSSHFFESGDGSLGLCLPSGCTPNDVQNVLTYFAPKIMVNASLDSCQVKDASVKFNGKQLFFIWGSSFFLSLGIIASIVDHWLKKKNIKAKSAYMEVVLCFSLTRNFKKIVNVDVNPDTRSLACLHGIRVLSIFYIVLAHQYVIIGAAPSSRNMFELEDFSRRFFTQILINAIMTVEVFFFLSGFLHSYLRTTKDSSGKISDRIDGYFKMILLRIWRLAPIYIATVFLYFLMIPRGPFVPEMTRILLKNCEKRFWWNLIFLQNFLHWEVTCLPQSWYISADMQLFLLSLIPIGFLIRNQNIGFLLGSMLTACGIITTMVWCWVVDAPPTAVTSISRESIYRYLSIYMLPFPHIATYFTGVFLGFYLAKENEVKIPKIYQVIGWPLSFLFSTSMMFVTWKWNNGMSYTPLESALYFTFSRILYIIGVSWVVVCCVTGYGGIINYILSLKIWFPLSRISYAVYLLSPVLQMFYKARSRYPDDIQEMHTIWRFMGDIMISSLLALVFVMLFESPNIALQKHFFPPSSRNSEKKREDTLKDTENAASKTNEISLSEWEGNEKNSETKEDKVPVSSAITK